jgi:hypothetical protein
MFLSKHTLNRLKYSVSLAALALLVVFVEGCESSKGDIKGKVTYNGKAIEGGSVTVQSSTGGIYTGEVGSDGSYVVKGVPKGPAKLTVGWIDNSAVEKNVALLKGKRDLKQVEKPGDRPTLADPQKLPAKYGDFNQSGLTVEVKGPVTEYNIDLKD